MMQRPWTLVGSFVILTAGGIVGCSSADDPEGTETGGTGGTATGGTAPTGGTATGGTTPTGGASTGGTTGSGGSSGTSANCKGISRDTPCPGLEGTMCMDLVCGLADSGTRDCSCATNWTCTSCDYTGSWTEMMPTDVMPCPEGVADEVTCTTDHVICGPQPNGEYCACWMSPSDGQSWDCDDPPSSWGLQ